MKSTTPSSHKFTLASKPIQYLLHYSGSSDGGYICIIPTPMVIFLSLAYLPFQQRVRGKTHRWFIGLLNSFLGVGPSATCFWEVMDTVLSDSGVTDIVALAGGRTCRLTSYNSNFEFSTVSVDWPHSTRITCGRRHVNVTMTKDFWEKSPSEACAFVVIIFRNSIFPRNEEVPVIPPFLETHNPSNVAFNTPVVSRRIKAQHFH